jgi:hypothetical protein
MTPSRNHSSPQPKRPIVQISLDLTTMEQALEPARLVGRVEPLASQRACHEEMASGDIVKGVLKP